MTANALLQGLRDRGVELWAEGERIRFRAPAHALTEQDRSALRDNRNDIIRQLRQDASARTEQLPLSAGQQSLWMLHQLAGAAPVNNLGTAIRIGAPPDPATTTRAAQLLVDRHPMLRATFHVEGDALVQRVPGTSEPTVTLHDAATLDPAALHQRIQAENATPYDLEQGPLFRIALFDCGPAGHVLLLSTHHIVSDGLSMLVLLGELMTTWAELRLGTATAGLPPLHQHYADFIRDEAAMLAGPQGQAMAGYWSAQLERLPPPLRLPADRQRPGPPSFRGDTIRFALSATATARLGALSREAGTTLFTVLLATWSMFLARLTGTTDMVVGTPVALRADEESYQVVGDFVNALPLRLRLGWGDSLRQVVAAHRQVVLGALDAKTYPVQEMINRLGTARNAGASPLFNCFFNFQQLHLHRDFAALARGLGDGMEIGGIRLDPVRLGIQLGQFDLTLSLAWFGETEMGGSLDYADDLFDAATIQRLADDYVGLVETLAADPDETLLSRGERNRVLALFNETTLDLPTLPFPAQFEASARKTPASRAVRCGDTALDYATLARQADRLARRLRDSGAAPGAVVGVHLQRSTTLLVALIATQLAGATLLPLDPAFPAERLAHMMRDSGAKLLLSDTGRPDWLPGPVTTIDPRDDAAPVSDTPIIGVPAPGDIAYILYTSGSTGTPNGVRVTHRALSNLLGAIIREPGLHPADILAAVTTISFDIAMVEMFAPLLVGAAIEIVPQTTARDARALAALIDRTGATIMQATPATWRMLVEADWRPPPGFRAMSGGEAMTTGLADALLSRSVELWNLYGPTETTIYSTGGQVRDPAQIDVGRPIANTRIYVLDTVGELVPVGVAGRVWIGGTGIAQGYHQQPGRTAERFRPDPFVPGERIYDTGDLGRWVGTGRLDIVGRSDDQIKLRGFRIEPSEVEAALCSHPDIQRATVAARAAGDDLRLVAYLVHVPGTAPTNSELRQHVREILPDYMVPAIFVALTDMPLTPNGKVDRRQLPDPFAQIATGQPGRAPRPGLEQDLAQIWREVLAVEHVSVDDKFFEIGGHSLLALRVVALLERRTGLVLQPTALFFQTLGQLAEFLANRRTA